MIPSSLQYSGLTLFEDTDTPLAKLTGLVPCALTFIALATDHQKTSDNMKALMAQDEASPLSRNPLTERQHAVTQASSPAE
jgi:hypothetical protein